MWTVYRNTSTGRYTVAQTNPGAGWIYAYGPASWEACWTWIGGR
jgi:hypothetical protein